MTEAPPRQATDLTSLIDQERVALDLQFSPPVSIFRPTRQTVPIVFCSPHSGRDYPAPFLATSRLDALSLRRSEDAFVDQLFVPAIRHGAPLLAARFPRAYLDVNREPYELDPRLIDGPMPPGANTQSARVAGGLGTVPRLVADGEDIYAGRLPVGVVLQRIDRLYHPFHAALGDLIAETQRQFGMALVVDCHSMPSAGQTSPQPSPQRPHFVIGDRFGTSCAPEIARTVTDVLASAGYDVSANRPYAGGFITEHYGRPHARVHAIQIEINRALYLREATLEPSADFAAFADVIESLIHALALLGESWLKPYRIAAE